MKLINSIKFCLFLLFTVVATQLQAQTTELYGMTPFGGSDNLGVIFKTDANGENQSVVYNFTNIQGKQPNNGKLCEVNGKLYGTTSKEGVSDMGVLYEYNPTTGIYIKLHDFDGIDTGRSPYSNVILASNGKLYGTTMYGGLYDFGVLFEFDLDTNLLTKKLDFDGVNMGKDIFANVIQASNGKLYGVANRGGAYSAGVLYEYDYTTEMFTKLIDFQQVPFGRTPTILVEVESNILYGTCNSGGANGNGTIFKYVIPTNTITKKFDFDSTINGASPYLSLMKSTNGKLYGLTKNGGINNMGVLYEYDMATETATKKQDFSFETGGSPGGGLLEAINGNLYGLTQNSGLNGDGTIFEFNLLTDEFIVKYDFALENGRNPNGTFMQASNGKLYATTRSGGASNSGVLFEYDTQTNEYVRKIDFNNAKMGSLPSGSLLRTANGKIYGLTSNGGEGNGGVLFEFDPVENTVIKKHDFYEINGGRQPYSSLIQASSGKLYGMTQLGGTNNNGVIFEFDPTTDTYSKKFDFNYSTTGSASQYGRLLEVSNSKFYGMTHSGGELGGGVLFEYDPLENTFLNRVNFGVGATGVNGAEPYGSLMKASNGYLYGLTGYGGIEGRGVLFEYNITTNSYTKKHDFKLVEGNVPTGTLIQALNGKLYGTTASVITNYKGTLFEYDPITGIYADKIYFDDSTGHSSYGDLLEASNGKLYGLTYIRGENFVGTLFEYDTTTESIIKKLDFDIINGANPYGNLIEIEQSTLGNNEFIRTSNDVAYWPNPVRDILNVKSNKELPFSLKIYDLLGQKLQENENLQNTYQLKVSHLKPGIYILQIIFQSGNSESIKFIKN